MSGILATATKTAIRLDEVAEENILLRRQVEVLLVRIDRMSTDCADEETSDACCNSCPMYDQDCDTQCVENMKQWSLEQARKGQP